MRATNETDATPAWEAVRVLPTDAPRVRAVRAGEALAAVTDGYPDRTTIPEEAA